MSCNALFSKLLIAIKEMWKWIRMQYNTLRRRKRQINPNQQASLRSRDIGQKGNEKQDKLGKVKIKSQVNTDMQTQDNSLSNARNAE